MKKITFFIASLSSGGAEHQLSILSNLLIEKKYTVEIVTYSDKEDHYYLSPLIKRIRLAPGKNKICKFISIIRFFRKNKTDIVISFGSRDNTLATLSIIFGKKTKLIVSERCVMYRKPTWYQKLNYLLLYRVVDHIVPNSHTQAAQISTQYPYLDSKITTITNYTDLNNFQMKDSFLGSNEIRIGIFSRFVKQKNYKRFSKAIRELKNRCKQAFKISWYGNIGTPNKPNPDFLEFKKLIREFQIEDHIELYGHVKDTPALIPTFDVMCLPSLTEGFSNSISEYICCGKPVLCSDVADNKYLVHDGYNGFLFNPYDIDNMVDAFIKFFELSDNERLLMSLRSREIAEALFDNQKFVNNYIQLIEA